MDSEIQQFAGEILDHPLFQQLRGLQHHGEGNSVYDHSVAVAKAAYAIARRMRLSGDETASIIRAALLHDFFGYDWRDERFRRYLRRYSGIKRMMRMHAFVHGHIAAEYFWPDRTRVRGYRTAYVPACGNAAHADRLDRDARRQSRRLPGDGCRSRRISVPSLS